MIVELPNWALIIIIALSICIGVIIGISISKAR